ncbi:MAG: replication initiator protein [Microviridae sp.]|nr:MAG: replication initiator protein [Microviridae sp.]
MPCYSPLTGYKSKHLTENGKRKITFSRNHGLTDLVMTVPCGQCIGCRIDRSRMWAIRCVHESKLHEKNCFITLTYDDENLPPDLDLQKTDLQKFFKRLRKQCGEFRYFACGEYGDKGLRPHYHAIIFGLNFSDDRKQHSSSNDKIYFKSDTLTKIWGKGHCLLSTFTYATAAYTARYVMKKQNGKNAGQHSNYTRLTTDGELYQVSPEFACMSLRPGLGSGWYDRYKSDAFPSDFLVHEGKKHPVPRYYLDKLSREAETDSQQIKMKRKMERKKSAPNNTPDRLAVREECKQSQLNQLKRSL